MNSEKENIPIVTIGIPVLNGEKFLHKRLESILSQSLTNFEAIISDNGSTDNTQKICEEYAKKDNRIRYIRQSKNMGPRWNFDFVLKEAKFDYFVLAAADDYWSSDFLESNVRILEANEKIVGSISKIKYFDDDGLIENKKESPYHKYPLNGTYEEKASFYLRTISAENIYAVFRTEAFKQSQVREMTAADGATLLKILKFGDIIVSDAVLLFRYIYGMSNKDLFQRIRDANGVGIIGLVFPFLPFTLWCLKNVGIKFFLKNIDYFFKINASWQKAIIMTLLLRLKNDLSSKSNLGKYDYLGN